MLDYYCSLAIINKTPLKIKWCFLIIIIKLKFSRKQNNFIQVQMSQNRVHNICHVVQSNLHVCLFQ